MLLFLAALKAQEVGQTAALPPLTDTDIMHRINTLSFSIYDQAEEQDDG